MGGGGEVNITFYDEQKVVPHFWYIAKPYFLQHLFSADIVHNDADYLVDILSFKMEEKRTPHFFE